MNAKTPTVDKSSARVRAMFGEIAPKYDLLNDFLSFGLARLWRRRLVREIFRRLEASPRDPSVPIEARTLETLDVATGTGDVVVEERRQWDARRRESRKRGRKSRKNRRIAGKLRTVGVDFVPEMLALARVKAPEIDGELEFAEADALALPFESDRFDATTNAFGLRNAVDPEKCVAEAIRVCRPGGVVSFLEFAPPRFPIFAPIFRFYFHRILPLIGNAVAKNRTEAYRYLPESVDAFDSPARVLEYMRRNGVPEPVRIPLTFGVLGIFIGIKK